MDTASKLLNETSPAIPAGRPAFSDAGSDGQAESPLSTSSPLMSCYILIAVLLITTGALIHYTLPGTHPYAKPKVVERVLPIP